MMGSYLDDRILIDLVWKIHSPMFSSDLLTLMLWACVCVCVCYSAWFYDVVVFWALSFLHIYHMHKTSFNPLSQYG